MALGVVCCSAAAAPPSAASKEHQQLMAELRMHAGAAAAARSRCLIALADTLKTVTTTHGRSVGRHPQGAGRSDAADQRHDRHGAGAAREVRRDQRAALDDFAGARVAPPDDLVAARAAAVVTPAGDPTPIRRPVHRLPPRRRRASAPPAMSRRNASTTARYSDYTAGQYDLAIEGFRTFLKYFPGTMQCRRCAVEYRDALYNAGKSEGSGHRVPAA